MAKATIFGRRIDRPPAARNAVVGTALPAPAASLIPRGLGTVKVVGFSSGQDACSNRRPAERLTVNNVSDPFLAAAQ